MSINIVPDVTKARILDLASKGKRVDGRGLLEYRPISVRTGLIEKAEGSAEVSIGSTRVMVGVKVEIGEPFPDTPDEGVLSVNAELVPLASPTFEPGPPNEDSIELARTVDRGLREGKALDLEKLVITPGKKVFVIFVDVYALDYDGNLVDAAALASMAALMQARMRGYKVVDRDVVWEDERVPLPVQHTPVAVSIGKLGNSFLVDPSLEEEQTLEARVTISVDEAGRICSIQKGPGSLSPQQVLEAVSIAKSVSASLLQELKEATPFA
ncbi:MAG: exosome complex protein Rrp42 [Candidatus Bathyarchaeia archaeon]